MADTMIDRIRRGEFVVYLAGRRENLSIFNTNPFGLEVAQVDALNSSNEGFLNLLHGLDSLTYSEDLKLPRWVMVDCGIITSAFIGLAKPATAVDPKILERFGIRSAGYIGLVPITSYCANPTAQEIGNCWAGYTLSTVEPGKNLGTITKAIGLAMLPAKRIMGVAQYDNGSWRVHARFSNLTLENAIVYSHTYPDRTFIYSHKVPDTETLLEIIRRPIQEVQLDELNKRATFFLDPTDKARMQDMQLNIESGRASYEILYPGKNKIGIPILEKT